MLELLPLEREISKNKFNLSGKKINMLLKTIYGDGEYLSGGGNIAPDYISIKEEVGGILLAEEYNYGYMRPYSVDSGKETVIFLPKSKMPNWLARKIYL